MPANQDLALHIAVTARNMVDTAKRAYQLGNKPVAVANAAAAMNLNAVDEQFTAMIQRTLGVKVQFTKPPITLEAITEAVRIPAGDATVLNFPQLAYSATDKMHAKVRRQILNNVQLIKSIPEEYFERLADSVYQNISQAKRWENLSDRLIATIIDDGEITRRRANTIARDQTAKMTAAFNEERQTSVGVTHYQWQTAGDERVRPEHADNDGQIFAWDDPPAETGHPGHDVNCRCVALAVFEELEVAA